MKNLKPRTIEIEFSGACNLRCISCDYCNRDNSQINFMDYELFLELLNQIQAMHIKPVITNCCFGEATLYPRIIEAMQELNRRDFKHVQFYTNGANLTEDMSKEILTNPAMDIIMLSIYGHDEANFDSFTRTKGHFKKTQANMIRFSELAADKKYFRYPAPRIGYALVAKNDWEESNKFWTSYKNNINAMRLEVLGDKFLKPPKYFRRRAMTVPWNMMSMAGKVSKFKGSGSCIGWQLFNSVEIYANGDVSFCCTDTHHEGLMGNIKQDSLYNIFNTRQVKEWRSAFLDGDVKNIPLCRSCEFATYPYIPAKLRRRCGQI